LLANGIMQKTSPLPLSFLAHLLESADGSLLHINHEDRARFLEPQGEEALISHDSISWRIFKNPVALLVGGIAAVILELAEPRVRTGVWEHTQFRSKPLLRMRHTASAAMTTVYGAHSVSEKLIANISRRHENIRGTTPSGQAYYANDPELLNWVHATATFGFLEAYSRYVCTQDSEHRDAFCREGLAAAKLFGASHVPASYDDLQTLLTAMENVLEPSPIVFEFINVVRSSPILPTIFRPLQRVLIRAAIDIVPLGVRQTLCLADDWALTPWERGLVRQLGRTCERLLIQSSPAVLSCLRLGLPCDFLYRDSLTYGGGRLTSCESMAKAARTGQGTSAKSKCCE